jgi:serine protease Do
MKKNIFFAGTLAAFLLASVSSFAQEPKDQDKKESQDKKSKEIIIRQKGDDDKKMTIVVDGENITVNGKPLSEFHDGDVSILSRDMKRDSRNFLYSPRINRDMDVHIFNDDMNNGKPRTFLGVLTEKTNDGATITDVIKGSAAEKAGLQKDDIITGVDDKKITSPEDLMDAVKSYKPDDNVKIDYLRNNKKKDAKVKLGETKERSRTFSFNGDPGMYKNFDFRMPEMPRMPKSYYNFNYNLWNNDQPKVGIKIEDTENGSGAKVLNVEEGSAADKAGLKKDDIITEVNGEKIKDVGDVKDELNEARDKESFTVKAKRNNSEMNFEIKIPKKLNSAEL